MNETMSVRASLAWTRDVVRNWGRWTRSHWAMTLGLSALAFVVGWVWNTYLMAVDLEGSVVGPESETTATADGHTGNGLFWLLLFSLAGGLITYAWSRGWKNFWSDVAALPRRFAEGLASSRTGALAMLLWGASVSLLISTLISSAVSLALGLVLLALAATPIGVILNFALIRLWRGLSGIVAPNAGARLAVMVSPLMVMLGEALGLFLDWMIGQWLIGLVLGIACGVLSVLLARGAAPRAAAWLLVIGLAVAWQVLRVRWAYADDGGWNECRSPEGRPCSDAGLLGIFDWVRSPGAGHLIVRGAVGGLFATIGAVLGVGLGGAAAGLAVAAAQTATPPRAPGPSSGDEQAARSASTMERTEPVGQTQAFSAERSAMSDAQVPTPRDASLGASGQSDLAMAADSGGPTGTGSAGMADGGGQSGSGQSGSGPSDSAQGDSAQDAGEAGTASHRGYGYQFDVSDIVPEEPDRKDDDE
jgi:hypothetical protein